MKKWEWLGDSTEKDEGMKNCRWCSREGRNTQCPPHPTLPPPRDLDSGFHWGPSCASLLSKSLSSYVIRPYCVTPWRTREVPRKVMATVTRGGVGQGGGRTRVLTLEICCWRWAMGRKIWSGAQWIFWQNSVVSSLWKAFIFALSGPHFAPASFCILVSASMSYQAFSFSFLCPNPGFSDPAQVWKWTGKPQECCGAVTWSFEWRHRFQQSVEGDATYCCSQVGGFVSCLVCT